MGAASNREERTVQPTVERMREIVSDVVAIRQRRNDYIDGIALPGEGEGHHLPVGIHPDTVGIRPVSARPDRLLRDDDPAFQSWTIALPGDLYTGRFPRCHRRSRRVPPTPHPCCAWPGLS